MIESGRYRRQYGRSWRFVRRSKYMHLLAYAKCTQPKMRYTRCGLYVIQHLATERKYLSDDEICKRCLKHKCDWGVLNLGGGVEDVVCLMCGKKPLTIPRRVRDCRRG